MSVFSRMFLSCILIGLPLLGWAQLKEYQFCSPDKKVCVRFFIQDQRAWYEVSLAGKKVLGKSQLGLILEDTDLSTGLGLVEVSGLLPVSDSYYTRNAKKSNINYIARKKVFKLKNGDGNQLDVIFQVSNDGVAFRYYLPDSPLGMRKIKEEITSYHFLKDTKGWLQPMADAKTGWEHTNPSYEEYYEKEIPVGKSSPNKAGWVFPALFKSAENVWVLLSEAGLERNYCASRLRQDSPGGEYRIGFPQEPERFSLNEARLPESKLPWYTPWRIIVVGSLKVLNESTLGTDLAVPAAIQDTSYLFPGKAAWSWGLYKDDSTTYDAQKRFINYASDMKWEYNLIDASWDEKIGYEKMRELAAYAKSKNVGLLLWYNSAGDWNTVKLSPKDKLLSKESRNKEFSILKDMGVKGVKIDFFGGDGQSMIAYYIDILEDAAKYGLMVNFHGCTLPRGWQRTYPNLMTMESVKGLEFITFEQANADEEASHATTLPFTRNVFDPMDFTPMVLHEIPGIVRKTTSTFELALPVVFLSGIQHFGETPEGMALMPKYVKTYLQDLPTSWDDTKFIGGYPGKYFVVARRSGKSWFISGINAENHMHKLTIDLSFIKTPLKGYVITDGENGNKFSHTSISLQKPNVFEMIMKPNGGFSAVLN